MKTTPLVQHLWQGFGQECGQALIILQKHGLRTVFLNPKWMKSAAENCMQVGKKLWNDPLDGLIVNTISVHGNTGGRGREPVVFTASVTEIAHRLLVFKDRNNFALV